VTPRKDYTHAGGSCVGLAVNRLVLKDGSSFGDWDDVPEKGVTTRKCQNCPVRENQTWTILGLEREIAPLERVKDAAGGIWSSFQGEKRPLDCLISIAKQSLCVDCRLQAP
jgi:hypothetical protein